ncbi:hypothetical protein [Gracilinema caldarium]|uniref:hypothetical protein n=1 Tax=Gracilinema caldarium TaxID=215591 RepID=UPI0026F342F7|nr:hypothetical protein [Gracilinema caldarium]
MKGVIKQLVVLSSGILLSLSFLISCSSLGYGRRVEQVGDYSYPPAGPLLDNGELKLEFQDSLISQLDDKCLEDHQIICRGNINKFDMKPFSSEFYEKTFKKFIFYGNIVTNNQNVFIKGLPFVVAADDKPKGYGEQGYGEKRVWFNFSSVSEQNFSVNYNKSLDNYNTIPNYPVELMIITMNSNQFKVYAVYEPLYETVPFWGKGPSKNPLRNMDNSLAQLKTNDQKYQIVNRDGKAVAEVYKHRYQIFDGGDPVINKDSAIIAGLVYTTINVTNMLESSKYWYK